MKLNPKLAVPTIKLAELYVGPLHNNEKALVYAKKARELAPTDPQITLLLGKVAYQTGNFSWSYSLLQEAAGQRRDDPAVLYSLGWSAYAMGKVNEARDLMQKVEAAGGGTAEIADAKKFLTLPPWTRIPNSSLRPRANYKGTRGERRLCACFDGSGSTLHTTRPSQAGD